MPSLLSYAREHRGFTINILLAVYGLMLDPLLSGPAQRTLVDGETNYTFAAVVLVVLVLELLATPYKISAVFYALAQKGQSIPVDPETGLPRDRLGTMLFMSSLFRLAISGYFMALMMAAVGIPELKPGQPLLWFCMGFVLIKEIVYFVLILSRIKRPRPVAPWKVTLGDVFYALFYDFVFTVFWGILIVRDQTVRAEEGWSIVFGMILVAIVYCLVFLPIRLPYLIEEAVKEHTSRDRWLLALSFFLALGAGLRPIITKVMVGRHTSLETALRHPERVQSLYLQRQQLETLPRNIGNMTELRVLYLYANRLTILPPEIGKLKKLESINLMFNRLTALPPDMGKLQQLQKLFLYRNALAELPEAIGSLKRLEVLDLQYNRLRKLPSSMRFLQRLRDLHLDHNPLTHVPAWICELKQLRKLSLRHTSIHALPSCLRTMPHLTKIYTYGSPYYQRRMQRLLKKTPQPAR